MSWILEVISAMQGIAWSGGCRARQVSRGAEGAEEVGKRQEFDWDGRQVSPYVCYTQGFVLRVVVELGPDGCGEKR